MHIDLFSVCFSNKIRLLKSKQMLTNNQFLKKCDVNFRLRFFKRFYNLHFFYILSTINLTYLDIHNRTRAVTGKC